jgi:aminopeptidase N
MRGKRFVRGLTLCFVLLPLAALSADRPDRPSIVHYDLRLDLDVVGEKLSGEVTVTARGHGTGSDALSLDVGDLVIDSVAAGRERLAFDVADHKLSVRLPASLSEGRSARVSVRYHGQPKHGLRFFEDRRQAYTAFSTSQWVPAVDAPDEKATLRLRLTVPDGLVAVASGKQVGRRSPSAGRIEYEWVQRKPLPTYVFGFAVGPFRRVGETRSGLRLEYLGTLSEAELRRVFVETGSMIDFFEEKAGARFPGGSYAQVLAAGEVEQEVGLFTLLSESYGRRLLDEPGDLGLMAHELAHQWWGNSVTCRDWNHFWLNEGMATFLADAYLERRFGREVYSKKIEAARGDYDRVRRRGGDKPLVFPDWLKPSADDRVIVYRKGAYVLHLLRESLGDAPFWAGLRAYTRRYLGGSVTTADFQSAMETSTGRDLHDFFDRWVYSAGPDGAGSIVSSAHVAGGRECR